MGSHPFGEAIGSGTNGVFVIVVASDGVRRRHMTETEPPPFGKDIGSGADGVVGFIVKFVADIAVGLVV